MTKAATGRPDFCTEFPLFLTRMTTQKSETGLISDRTLINRICALGLTAKSRRQSHDRVSIRLSLPGNGFGHKEFPGFKFQVRYFGQISWPDDQVDRRDDRPDKEIALPLTKRCRFGQPDALHPADSQFLSAKFWC